MLRTTASLVSSANNKLLTIEKVNYYNFKERDAEYKSALLTQRDSEGKLIWEREITIGGGDSSLYKASADKNGNYYITGDTDINLNGQINNSQGAHLNTDGFLIKLDSTGNTKWTRLIGGYSEDWISTSHADASGNVYVAGSARYDSEALFGEKITQTYQGFIAKYSSNGI